MIPTSDQCSELKMRRQEWISQQVVISQYFATLAMLEEAIVKCPDDLWAADDDRQSVLPDRLPRALLHAPLRAAHTGRLHALGEALRLPPAFGQPSYPGGPTPEPASPYTRDDILEYLELCRNEISRIVPTLDFDAESGFHWLPFGKLELQFYSIRHVMLHVGELAERLSAANGIEIGWVGRDPGDSA